MSLQELKNRQVRDKSAGSSGPRFTNSISNGRRLLAAAALLHVALSVGLFLAGRTQVAPNFIDRNGIIGSFAFDSYQYQREAIDLAALVRQGRLGTWLTVPAPLHVKLISMCFAALPSLLGEGPLRAEPFNLICYLAVVGLTFALAREIGGQRVGVFAAAVVAVWPTFLLHSLQLLKDHLLIAVALAVVLCVTTWLTRTYGRREAIITGAVMAVAALLMVLVRPSFVIVMFALVACGLVLLAVRQIVEKRLLVWNTACPLLIVTAGLLLLPFATKDVSPKFKTYPSDQSGPLKSVGGGAKVEYKTVVSNLPRIEQEQDPQTYLGRLDKWGQRVSLRVASVRYKFAAVYSDSGSNIDTDVKFRSVTGLLRYLPRAFEIGCCAPFPQTWATAGRRVGNIGKLLSGTETLVMYAMQLLALLALFRGPRRLASALLLSISVVGVTLLGVAVPNVGALYRFRYTFWVLLIILGVTGFEHVLNAAWRRARAEQPAVAAQVSEAAPELEL